MAVALVGCASTSTSWVSDPSDPNNVKIENAIWKEIHSQVRIARDIFGGSPAPFGLESHVDLRTPDELTAAVLKKVLKLDLHSCQLTDVTSLETLTQLTCLNLKDNPALTKAQIDELQKALPKCSIEHDFAPAQWLGPIPPHPRYQKD